MLVMSFGDIHDLIPMTRLVCIAIFMCNLGQQNLLGLSAAVKHIIARVTDISLVNASLSDYLQLPAGLALRYCWQP
jgi:hypothetical protein